MLVEELTTTLQHLQAKLFWKTMFCETLIDRKLSPNYHQIEEFAMAFNETKVYQWM